MYDVARAKSLQKDGLGATEIARIMGLPNESSARSLLDSNSESTLALDIVVNLQKSFLLYNTVFLYNLLWKTLLYKKSS